MNCRFVRRSLVLLACGAALAATSPLRADPAPSAAARGIDASSKTKFTDALRLYRAGKFAAALPAFTELAETTLSPNARLYVGHCLAQLGRHADAYRAFTLTVKEIVANPAEKYEQTREAAQAQLAILNVRVAKLSVVVAEVPAGFTLSLDDSAVQEKDFGSSIVVEPGAHRIAANAPGFEAVQREVSVDGGESKAIHLALRPVEAAKGQNVDAPAPPVESAPSGHGGKMRTAAWVAGGVGVAGLAAFAIAGLAAKGAYEGLQQECGEPRCSDQSHLDDIRQGKSLQTIANIGLVVSGLGLAAGGTLWALSRREAPTSAASLTWLPGGGTISYKGHF